MNAPESKDTLKANRPAPDRCGLDAIDPPNLASRAEEASNLLKALAHDGRLMILCHLAAGEKSVTELESLLFSRQAAGQPATCAAPPRRAL